VSESRREIVIAPQERGWAVIARYIGGQWDGFETTYYCRWYWQARREYDRKVRELYR